MPWWYLLAVKAAILLALATLGTASVVEATDHLRWVQTVRDILTNINDFLTFVDDGTLYP